MRELVATTRAPGDDAGRVADALAPLLGFGAGRPGSRRRSGPCAGSSSASPPRGPVVVVVRRHPLGGADVPRPGRVPGRLDPVGPGAARVPGAPRAARDPPGVADREGQRDPDRAPPAERARERRPDPRARRRRRARRARRAPGSPPSARATRCSSRRSSGCSSTTACCSRRTARWSVSRRPVGGHDPADDPRAAHRPAGPARGAGARRGRARRRSSAGRSGGARSTALSAPAARPGVAASLQALVRKDLIEPGPLRDVGGRTPTASPTSSCATPPTTAIPKMVRASMHEQLAEWIERAGARPRAATTRSSSATTSSRRIARCTELGPPTEQSRALAARAARPLAAAGERAFARGDMPAAVNLLGRAGRAPARARPRRLELLPELAFALMETADFDRLVDVSPDDGRGGRGDGRPDAPGARDRRRAGDPRLHRPGGLGRRGRARRGRRDPVVRRARGRARARPRLVAPRPRAPDVRAASGPPRRRGRRPPSMPAGRASAARRWRASPGCR